MGHPGSGKNEAADGTPGLSPKCRSSSAATWNMAPHRFQEEAKSFLTEMKTEMLAPKDVATKYTKSTAIDSVVLSSGLPMGEERSEVLWRSRICSQLRINRAPLDVNIEC